MRRNGHTTLLHTWGRQIYRYRKAIVVTWLLLFCGLLPFAFKLPSILQHNGFTPKDSPAQIGIEKLEEGLGLSAASLDIVVVSQHDENLTAGTAQRRILTELAPLRARPYVRDIYMNMAAHKAGQDHIVSVTVLLDLDSTEALKQFEEIRDSVPDITGADTYITGNTAIFADMNQAVKSDIIHAEMVGIPAALLILAVVFGTLTAAILPLLAGVASVVVTMGILYFVALADGSISNFLPNVVTMLGLAVGIDYALLVVSRFKEEMRTRSGDVGTALAVTCATAGKAVMFSGAAVLIGFVAMSFIDLPIFRSFSIGGITVVLLSVLAGNTLLPALLGILGPRIETLPLFPAAYRTLRARQTSGMWRKLSRFVMAHPVTISIAVIGLLLVAIYPVRHMNIAIPAAEVLPPAYESRYGHDLLIQAYDERELNSIVVAVELPASYEESLSIELMKVYTDEIRMMPGVKQVESYLSIGRGSVTEASKYLSREDIRQQLEQHRFVRGNMAAVAVIPEYGESHALTMQLVQALRTMDTHELTTYVTGSPAYKLDIMDAIHQKIAYVLVFVFVVTYVILLLAFRSVVLPLKASIMNMLSLGAGLGIVVWVFQEGIGAQWLGVSSTGSIFALLPILIFCVVFGISMDYEVMMLSRMMENYERTGDNEFSTAEGLESTGGLITSAALILAVVVGAFVFTDNEVMKAIGLGLTAAVLLDATVIRVLLVPAFMKMMGKANWWSPRWMFPAHKLTTKERSDKHGEAG
ncbi:transporter [Paenibacillus lautus]|uniref:MMPL family transporter n=1 Tax=Paenibacillus lautus TaxID=1401 RepID=UPI001B03BEF2|nr:MMPL family transporter [Paenibacillus lautus]GIO95517.1 transporter [Paenibacillus lautus]